MDQKMIDALKDTLRRCSSDVPNCERCYYFEDSDCNFRAMAHALKYILELEESNNEKTKRN